MLSFAIPDGWELPPDAKPGQPFQGVGTFILNKDGKTVGFTEIDGTPLAEMADNEAAEDVEDDEETEYEQPEAVDGVEDMVGRAKAAGLMK